MVVPYFPPAERVDYRVVHRASASEAFITRVLPGKDSGIYASVRLPTTHSRLAAGTLLPSVVVVEVFRQGAFLLAHQHLGVPSGWHFITSTLRLQWLTAPPRMPHRDALTGILSARADVQTRKGNPYRVHWFLALSFNGTDTAVGEFEGFVLEESAYGLLRRSAMRRRSEPHTDSAPTAVATATGFEVHWDETDSFIFRRPSDHVVSMALVDATEAAITHGSSQRITALEMEFVRFAEHDHPIHCTDEDSGDDHTRRLEFHQDGAIVAFARSHHAAK